MVAAAGDTLAVCLGIVWSSLLVVAVVDRLAACWVSDLGSSSLFGLEVGDIVVAIVLELNSVLNSGVLLVQTELEAVEENIVGEWAVHCSHHIVDSQEPEPDLDSLLEVVDNCKSPFFVAIAVAVAELELEG